MAISEILSKYLSRNVADKDLEKRHLKRLRLLSELLEEAVEDYLAWKQRNERKKKQKVEAWKTKVGLAQSLMATVYGDGPYRAMANVFIQKVRESEDFHLTDQEEKIYDYSKR